MIRKARLDDVPTMRALISSYAEQGRMLFRSSSELYESLRDFKLYERDGEIVGCCALQIVWHDLAEIKSLVVRADCHGNGIGTALVQAVIAEAQELRLGQVFTLTLEEGFFVRLGFERVANESLPMKVWSDCVRCPKQERCDEIAMLLKLGAT